MTTQAIELSPAAALQHPIRLDWLGPLAIPFALTSFSVVAVIAGAA
jgi:hypothetical protein